MEMQTHDSRAERYFLEYPSAFKDCHVTGRTRKGIVYRILIE